MTGKSWGYFSIAIASAGYYGYYLQSADAFIWHWVLLLAIGIGILIKENIKRHRANEKMYLYRDLLFTALAFIIPIIPLPYGLSILLMIINSAYNIKRWQSR